MSVTIDSAISPGPVPLPPVGPAAGTGQGGGCVAAFELRERRSCTQQDLGWYRCGCGHGFRAAVRTDVGCPRCGSGQPW